MIKKLYILAVFCLSGTLLYAQVAMTMENCPFQIGTQIDMTVYNGQVSPPSSSTTGINNTWDFSYLSTASSYEYVMIIEGEEAIPCPDESTLDNMIVTEYELSMPDQALYTIGRLDADSLTVVGQFDATLVCDFMTDGFHVFEFPLEYGDSYSDPYAYSNGFAYTLNLAYVAFGSIDLPLGVSYDEVALIQIVDEVYIQNVFYAIENGKYKMVLTMDNDGFYKFYDSTVSLSIKDEATTSWTLKLEGNNVYQLQTNSNELVQWNVVNALGQHVNAQTNGKNIDLNNLPVGIYIAKAKCGEEMQTFKIQVR
jgi:hypothetical protein